jgi:hypothetical protein
MSVSLSEGKKVVAINWLRTIGKESLIRSTITVDVPKGTSPKLVEKLKAVISKTQLPMVVGEDVNTGSFKALLKEKLEEGAKIDLQSLGAYEYTRAKIEQPKAPKK